MKGRDIGEAVRFGATGMEGAHRRSSRMRQTCAIAASDSFTRWTSGAFPGMGHSGPSIATEPSATTCRAAGYRPELNVLCGIADVSTQSDQPVMKHLVAEVMPSSQSGTTAQ
jgi:hypothetical protein